MCLDERGWKKGVCSHTPRRAQLFKQKAADCLNKAEAIVKAHFPAHSPYISVIQDKLNLLLDG